MLLIQGSLISQHCECFLLFEELPVSHQRSVTPAPHTAASDHEIMRSLLNAGRPPTKHRYSAVRKWDGIWTYHGGQQGGGWVGGGERCNTEQWLFTQQLPHPGPLLLLPPAGTGKLFFFFFGFNFISFSRSMNFFSPRARSFSALLRLATLVLRCTHACAYGAALKGGSWNIHLVFCIMQRRSCTHGALPANKQLLSKLRREKTGLSSDSRCSVFVTKNRAQLSQSVLFGLSLKAFYRN